MAVSEMVSSHCTLRGNPKTLRRLDHSGEAGPVSVQIVGADPLSMAEAARVNMDRGAQIIDINMGCPAPKVCRQMAGSALLRDTDLVRRILDAVVAAVDVPVTLKIRTGWDRRHRNGVEIARLAEQCGIQALAVHGRTRACGFSGEAEYATIGAIKQAVSIPVIANGDIRSPEKARQVLEYTGADGIMIGRAAQGRPWIFREIDHFLRTGEKLPSPSPQWIKTILLQHLEDLIDFYGEYRGVRIARKHIGWYSRTHADSTAFRRRINHSNSAEQQQSLIREFFDRLAAKEVLAA